MKLAFFGEPFLAREYTQDVPAGIEVVEENPDVVIVLGGDGTFLSAERTFPGIAKFALRDRRLCRACVDYPYTQAIRRLCDGAYTEETVQKVEARARGQVLVGLNEVQIHSSDPRHSIRLSVCIEHDVCIPVIGDGIVVATTFGSTGYYKSITKHTFTEGFALAFNNPSEELPPKALGQDFSTTVTIIRDPGLVVVDNDPSQIVVDAGDEVSIVPAKQRARIIRM